MKTAKEIYAIINNMTAAQKAGQMFLLAYPGKDTAAILPLIKKYGICGCYISQDNAETFAEAENVSTKLQEYSLESTGIPLLLGVDQEGAWGILIPESHPGPGNMALCAANNMDAVEAMYTIIGGEMLSVGYNAVLGPCSDVNSNPDSPIIDTRSFGEFPDRVASCVSAAVKGLKKTKNLACLKHFPGHGATSGDTHREIPQVNKTLEQLMEEDLLPFKAGIDAGADMVMTSHIRYPKIDNENPATLSKIILNDVLRKSLGFSGVIVSDSMNMGAIRKTYKADESTLKALLAGVDVVMLSEEHYDHEIGDYLEKQIDSIALVAAAIENGVINSALVNEKLFRILDLKFNKMEIRSNRLSQKQIAANAQREIEIAKEAVGILQKKHWPLTGKIACVNTTPLTSYSSIMNSRGIGPNQAKPAYKTFIEELAIKQPFDFFSYEDAVHSAELLAKYDTLILLTEDYPLPGVDFNKSAQQEMVKRLIAMYAQKIIVAGLRSSYDFFNYPDTITYLTSYSSRTCSAIAAAHFLAGADKANSRFLAPVSVNANARR